MKKLRPEEKSQYRSVFRIANILYALSEGLNTVTDIANYCNIDKSTISRLLKSLQGPKLVVRDPLSHKYYIGHLFTKIFTNPKTSHMDLIFQSLDELKRLNELSEETTFLSIMVGMQYVRLYQVRSQHQLRFDSIETCRIDTEGPQIVGATSRTLVSQLDEKARQEAIKYLCPTSSPETAEQDQQACAAELVQVRSKGYYVSYNEVYAGRMGISAIVDNYTFPAAITIVGPEMRLKQKMGTLVPEILTSATIISKGMLSSDTIEEPLKIL